MEPPKSSIFDEFQASLPKPPEEKLPEAPLTKSQIRQRFQLSAGRALEALDKAMLKADWPDVVKAATAILDRAGYGPKSTVRIEELPEDLTNLSDEDLATRAEQIAGMLRKDTAKGIH